MSILLQKPGILTTLQGLRRSRSRLLGKEASGVMDRSATRLINILLGNADDEPVLEIHFPGPEICFEADAVVAIGGGDFTPTLDGQPVDNWRSFFAKKGSRFRFTGKRSGNRAYLAVKGGFKTGGIAGRPGGSRTDLAANSGGRKLEQGSRLELSQMSEQDPTIAGKRIASSILPMYSPFPTVRVVAGAEYQYLGTKGQASFLTHDFTISKDSNRMGFRLIGDGLANSKRSELISSAVSFGTIQLLPNGQLVSLMADHQTTGGYPRIAHVISSDLPLLAQLGANDKVAFHLVEIEEAERLAIEFERDLAFLGVAVRLSTRVDAANGLASGR